MTYLLRYSQVLWDPGNDSISGIQFIYKNFVLENVCVILIWDMSKVAQLTCNSVH